MVPDESRVGVRELRQNLSKYLRRVLEGEVLEVTDRGRSVALFTPMPEAKSAFEELIETGRVIRPAASLSTLPPPIGPLSDRASRALNELRDERL
jgi:prevent-host-death family protein